jgi:hypothetical protein
MLLRDFGPYGIIFMTVTIYQWPAYCVHVLLYSAAQLWPQSYYNLNIRSYLRLYYKAKISNDFNFLLYNII